jgi:O-methyltransferase
MRVKSAIENALRNTPALYRLGSRFYHQINRQFRTLSPGAPAAIRNAFELSRTDPDAARISGDFYEFGVFRGGTFLAASQTLDDLGLADVAMYGFDSFEGLPAPDGVDATDARFFEGQFSCSLAEVQRNLARHGMDLSRATLIKGFYSESLTEDLHRAHPFKPVAVALLDCDYYSSTMEALNWLDRYLVPGSILLFDDWFSYGDTGDLGQQRAFAEWLTTRPTLLAEWTENFTHHGRGFILRNRP